LASVDCKTTLVPSPGAVLVVSVALSEDTAVTRASDVPKGSVSPTRESENASPETYVTVLPETSTTLF
jgi:hypothetical protein